MNDLSQILSAGTLLIIETGENSDFSWAGPVRIIKDVTKAELVEQFRSDQKGDPRPDDFLPWLVKTGWAEDVDNVTSWHIGYGKFEP